MPNHIVIDARIRRATTGRYTDRLVEHLQDIDHENTYTILVQPDDPWRMKAGNFSTLPCPFPQFSFSPLPDLKFARQLYRLKPDLVHFTMTQQPLLYFGRIVTTTHDLTMFQFVRRGATPVAVFWLKMRLYHFLVWWSHKKSARIIVPTNTTAKEVAAFQPFTKKKLAVTYEASEPAMAVHGEQPAGVAGDFLLYVGTAFPHKNLPKMIEAFELLLAERPQLKLVITGKREEKHLKELIGWVQNRPSAPNIIFPGFVSDAELQWLYSHCKAYVFTSLSEGWGLPTLEAMAHGAPVATTNASVMPEVNGDAAQYFDPHDAADIAAKVAEVLDDQQLRKRLIAAGYEHIKQFSWNKMAKETLAIYTAVLGAK
jgi:glycosyltransferase involved in cell wall biosynthesis